MTPTIHASAVLIGARAVLIRGPSGSGKSKLVLAVLQAAAEGALPFARLVADDRAHVEGVNGRLLVRPAAALAGQIEVRGIGIRNLPHEPVGVVGLVVDLGSDDATRMPEPGAELIEIEQIQLPRLAVASGADPLPLLLARCAIPQKA
jgi:HPr kinase/phosphorylase